MGRRCTGSTSCPISRPHSNCQEEVGRLSTWYMPKKQPIPTVKVHQSAPISTRLCMQSLGETCTNCLRPRRLC
ncbi:unnamed protein product [Protopolystoma xenopodis]|uniref:Uncharacterized protein n=1 Tax=Protopolystoma xenopodis TaxID=117903 RepID=A0A3S5AP61_9PLAT|nr:unnamed protein product [Protopolystoma xenopodis]